MKISQLCSFKIILFLFYFLKKQGRGIHQLRSISKPLAFFKVRVTQKIKFFNLAEYFRTVGHHAQEISCVVVHSVKEIVLFQKIGLKDTM